MERILLINEVTSWSADNKSGTFAPEKLKKYNPALS
jgi:hypothetical protein